MNKASIIPFDWTSIQTTVRQLASQTMTKGLGLTISFQLVPLVLNGIVYTYSGTKTVLKKEAVNTSSGLNQNYVYSLLCDISQFTILPVGKQQIVVDGQTLKIEQLEKDAIGATLRLHLCAPYVRNG